MGDCRPQNSCGGGKLHLISFWHFFFFLFFLLVFPFICFSFSSCRHMLTFYPCLFNNFTCAVSLLFTFPFGQPVPCYDVMLFRACHRIFLSAQLLFYSLPVSNSLSVCRSRHTVQRWIFGQFMLIFQSSYFYLLTPVYMPTKGSMALFPILLQP